MDKIANDKNIIANALRSDVAKHALIGGTVGATGGMLKAILAPPPPEQHATKRQRAAARLKRAIRDSIITGVAGAGTGAVQASLTKKLFPKTATEIVDDAFEKTATRAWKKNYGNLSEATKQRLVDTGVHNYKKELIGLNKGTSQILKKNNARALFGKKQIMETLKRDHPNLPDSLIEEASNAPANTLKIPDEYRNPNAPSIYNVFQRRSDTSSPLKDLVDDKNMFKKDDPLGKLYESAITRRHEADEVRAMNSRNFIKNKKTDAFSALGKTPLTSHADPSVIMRESANVALAPKSTQNFYKGFRLRNTLGQKLSNSPVKDHYADRMKLVGKGYGQEAVFNRKQSEALKQKNNELVDRALNASKRKYIFNRSRLNYNKQYNRFSPYYFERTGTDPFMLFKRHAADWRRQEQAINNELLNDRFGVRRNQQQFRPNLSQLKPMSGTFKPSNQQFDFQR